MKSVRFIAFRYWINKVFPVGTFMMTVWLNVTCNKTKEDNSLHFLFRQRHYYVIIPIEFHQIIYKNLYKSFYIVEKLFCLPSQKKERKKNNNDNSSKNRNNKQKKFLITYENTVRMCEQPMKLRFKIKGKASIRHQKVEIKFSIRHIFQILCFSTELYLVFYWIQFNCSIFCWQE